RVEVALVELAHPDHERHELLDLDAALGQLPGLLGVVAQQAHAADAEVLEDPDSGPVVASVGGQAGRAVGVERVEAVLLQAVGTQLVDEADSTPLLTAQVDDHAALGLDRVERGLQLRAALALERAERLTRQALRVHAHESAVARLARDPRDMIGACRAVAVGAHPEAAVARRHGGLHLEAHALPFGHRDLRLRIALAATLLHEADERLDRDDGHVLPLA